MLLCMVFGSMWVFLTGISNISVDSAKAGKTYNLAGQQVSDSYKGLVIKNGKKYVK